MVYRSCVQNTTESEYKPLDCYEKFRENGQLIEREIEEKVREVVSKT